MNKKSAVLDLTGCKYLSEMHERIKEAFDFPDYYGRNWDAFWDCINRECDVNTVTVIGSGKVAKELLSSVETMIGILEENKQYWEQRGCGFFYEIVS